MKKLLNLKRLLKMRNNRGFTLVEIIIASVLLGVLVVGVVMFVTPLFDILKSNKKNARATMLAESIDTYIAGCIRGAQRIEVIQNTTLEDIMTSGLTLTEEAKKAKERIFKYMEAGTNATKFEVRCIGITWMTDTSTLNSAKKQILVNCTVDNNFSPGFDTTNTLKILNEDLDGDGANDHVTKVFDDSMYNNLYPRISIETFKTVDETGAETATNASGYKVSSKVYLDMDCYNVLSAERGNTNLSFDGAAHVECPNIKVAEPIVTIKDEQNAIDSGRSGRVFTENAGALGEKNYYYPDTFIFYVVPK